MADGNNVYIIQDLKDKKKSYLDMDIAIKP